MLTASNLMWRGTAQLAAVAIASAAAIPSRTQESSHTAADYSAGYGWYRLAVMPLVYLAAGRFLWLAVWELSWVRLGIAAALAIATTANWAVPLHIKFDAVNMGLIVLLAMLPALIALARPGLRTYARAGSVTLLAAI